jgi:hypothetical protein
MHVAALAICGRLRVFIGKGFALKNNRTLPESGAVFTTAYALMLGIDFLL